MITLPIRVDLVVQGADGEIVALVEVKNPMRLDADDAAAFRENLVVHGALKLSAPFFLLVSQDVGFLWDQRGSLSADARPTVEFPMEAIVQRYLPWLGPGERLREPELNIAVTQWLSDLTTRRDDRPGDAILADVGFLEMLKDGRVGMEIVL